MAEFIGLLSRLSALEEQVKDLTQRVHPIQVGTVQEHITRDGLRHIRVSKEQHSGQSSSYLIPAGVSSAYTDEPLPPVGSIVEIKFVEGNPHYPLLGRTLPGTTNPPDQTQQDPVRDSTTRVPGSSKFITEGDSLTKTGGDATIASGKNLTVTAEGETFTIDATEGKINISALQGMITLTGLEGVRLQDGTGAYIQMQGGKFTIRDAQGKQWDLGGGNWIFNLNGGDFSIENAGDFRVNGVRVAAIGAIDDRGDRLIGAGWRE